MVYFYDNVLIVNLIWLLSEFIILNFLVKYFIVFDFIDDE